MGVSAIRAGNRPAAYALFLALSHEYPGDVHAWLGLANVATSVDEQRNALEHVIALNPEHPQALRALARLSLHPHVESVSSVLPGTITDTSPELSVTIASELRPKQVDQHELTVAHGHFPLLNLIALMVMGVIVLALVVVGINAFNGSERAAGVSTPIPSLVPQIAAAVSTSPAEPTLVVRPTDVVGLTPVVTPTDVVGLTPVVRPTDVVGLTPVVTPTNVVELTPVAALPAHASLPLGTLVEVDGWSVTLLRPDYALVLEGSIGDVRPSGRFVLTLMAVSNNSTTSRRIPADLFALVDSKGRRYRPAPNVSTAYLALYGRGQHGDLALEDDLAPSSGMRSVPILFDVPANANGMVLTIRDSGSSGWPIESASSSAINVGP